MALYVATVTYYPYDDFMKLIVRAKSPEQVVDMVKKEGYSIRGIKDVKIIDKYNKVNAEIVGII